MDDNSRNAADGDRAVGAFLDFLARDMATHPENVTPLSIEWMDRMKDLVRGVKVNPDEHLEGDVGL